MRDLPDTTRTGRPAEPNWTRREVHAINWRAGSREHGAPERISHVCTPLIERSRVRATATLDRSEVTCAVCLARLAEAT